MTYTVPIWLILVSPIFSSPGMVADSAAFADPAGMEVEMVWSEPVSSETLNPNCGTITLDFKVGGRARSQVAKTC